MKSKEITTPANLIVGDYIFIVSWEKHKAKSAKIEKVAVKEIFKETHLHKMYGPGEYGLGIEWDKRRWHFFGYGAWDLRKTNWGIEFLSDNVRLAYKFYRLDQIEEAELFAKMEVPKRQLASVMERIDRLKKDFTSKVSEAEELEKIIEANEKCDKVQEV